MFKSKRAVESYILVLLIVSAVMGLFLVSILNGIYGNDNVNCNNVNFEVLDLCMDGKSFVFKIKNNGNESLDFTINDKTSPSDFRVLAYESRRINFIQERGDFLSFLPMIKVENGVSSCRGKLKSFDTNIIGKC